MLRVPQRQGRNINVQCHRTDLSRGLLIGIAALRQNPLSADNEVIAKLQFPYRQLEGAFGKTLAQVKQINQRLKSSSISLTQDDLKS